MIVQWDDMPQLTVDVKKLCRQPTHGELTTKEFTAHKDV